MESCEKHKNRGGKETEKEVSKLFVPIPDWEEKSRPGFFLPAKQKGSALGSWRGWGSRPKLGWHFPRQPCSTGVLRARCPGVLSLEAVVFLTQSSSTALKAGGCSPILACPCHPTSLAASLHAPQQQHPGGSAQPLPLCPSCFQPPQHWWPWAQLGRRWGGERRAQREGTKTHLQPLGLAVVERCPGVGFARLVQASIVGVPGKGIDAPGLEDAGGCDLLVGDEARLHAQGLRATCRVEIHCNTTVYTGGEEERVHSTGASKPPPQPAPNSAPCPLPAAPCPQQRQRQAGRGSAEAQERSQLASSRDV